MPEREFFSFRFAIPGYILILFIIAINYAPLFTILERSKAGEVFGAFLAFLSLFSGSALGFLVSQFWWWWFDRGGKSFGMGEPGEKAEEVFVNKYKGSEYLLTIPEGISESQRRKALEQIFDYIALTTSRGKTHTEDRLWKYGERKYDMFHVLSSTLLSLILGFALGTAIRLYYQLSVFDARFIIDEVVLPELWAYIFLLVSFVSLILIIHSARHKVEDEYCETLISIARHCEPDVKDLRRTFPDYFKRNEETQA